MFAISDIKQAPWHVVNAEDKKGARLNVVRHLLSMIPYEDLTPEPLKLPRLGNTKEERCAAVIVAPLLHSMMPKAHPPRTSLTFPTSKRTRSFPPPIDEQN